MLVTVKGYNNTLLLVLLVTTIITKILISTIIPLFEHLTYYCHNGNKYEYT